MICPVEIASEMSAFRAAGIGDHADHDSIPRAAVERAVKAREVILRAMAKTITWWRAAEILGISDRHMRRT
jgi:hypothetical protein